MVRLWAGLASDLRIAARRLWKEPGFTGIALLTLTLCIGANTAIFSLVYSMILKPLPFPEAGRIVAIFNDFPKDGLTRFPSNLTQYADFKANTSCFDSIALCSMQTVMMGAEGSPQRVVTANCTPDIFEVLGVKPLLGRFFTLENSRKGEEDVIVLTETFWKSHFNEDPGVLGRTIRLDETTYHIVGVAPKSLEILNATTRLLRPISWDPKSIDPNMRYSCSLPLYARLKPGVTEGRALAEITGIEKRFYDYRRAVMLLLGCFAALALFLSSIGIYGVLAYDVSQRRREIGIRGAIGATPPQVMGLVMAQGLWKIGIGLVVGLVCAILLSHTMASLLFELKPTDPLSYLWVALTLLAVATLATYLPAHRAAKIDPIETLRAE